MNRKVNASRMLVTEGMIVDAMMATLMMIVDVDVIRKRKIIVPSIRVIKLSTCCMALIKMLRCLSVMLRISRVSRRFKGIISLRFWISSVKINKI